MAGITLATAEAQLALWIEASEKVAAGQSYSIKDRSLTRVNANEIRSMIDYWQGKVDALSPRARSRTRYPVPTHE